MALPKQVQRQAEAIAEFDKQQVAAVEVGEAANAGTPETPPEVAPTPPVSAPASPTPAPPEPPSDAQQWEQRYRTLQGMFAQETRNLHAQVATLKDQLAELVQAKQRETPPAAPTALVTEQDTEAFGSDLIDMARRVAREEFGAREAQYIGRIAALETQVKQQVGEVQQTQQQTSREGFFAKLETAVPNWEQVQATPECQQWLASRMPGATFTWNDVLVDAAGEFNAERAAEVFTAFFAAHGSKQPSPTPRPAPPARAALSRQVSPPRAASAAPVPTDAKRVFTSAEYEQESMRVVRLNKQGQYAEATQIENELNAALMEGRLRP